MGGMPVLATLVLALCLALVRASGSGGTNYPIHAHDVRHAIAITEPVSDDRGKTTPHLHPTLRALQQVPIVPPFQLPPATPLLNATHNKSLWASKDTTTPASEGLSVAVQGTLGVGVVVLGAASLFGGSAGGALGGGGLEVMMSLQATGSSLFNLIHHSQVFGGFGSALTQLNVTKIDSYGDFFSFSKSLGWITFARLSPLHCKGISGPLWRCYYEVGKDRLIVISFVLVPLFLLHVVLVKVWACACKRGMVLPAMFVLPTAELAILGVVAMPLAQAATVLIANNHVNSRILGALIALLGGVYCGLVFLSLWMLLRQREQGVHYVLAEEALRGGSKEGKGGRSNVSDDGEVERQSLAGSATRSVDGRWQMQPPPVLAPWDPVQGGRRVSDQSSPPARGVQIDSDSGQGCCDKACGSLFTQWHGTWKVDVPPEAETALRKQYLNEGCCTFFCRAWKLTSGHGPPNLTAALELHDRLNLLFFDYRGDSAATVMWEGIRLLHRIIIGVCASLIFVGVEYWIMAALLVVLQGFYTLGLLYVRPYRSKWVGFFEFLANGVQFVMFVVCGMLTWLDGYNPRRNILTWLQWVVVVLSIIATIIRVLDSVVALEQLWYLMKRPQCLARLHGCLGGLCPCLRRKLQRMDSMAEDLELRTSGHLKGPTNTGGQGFVPHPVPSFTPPARLTSVKRHSPTPRSHDYSPYRIPVPPATPVGQAGLVTYAGHAAHVGHLPTFRSEADSSAQSGTEVTWSETMTNMDDTFGRDHHRATGGTWTGSGISASVSGAHPQPVGSAGYYRQVSDTQSYFTDFVVDDVQHDALTLGGAADRNMLPELQWAKKSRAPHQSL